MTADAASQIQKLRDCLAKARALKQIIRDAPDRQRRDAAIIDYTRVVDLLVEDLIALEDTGLLADCIERLGLDATQRDDPLT